MKVPIEVEDEKNEAVEPDEVGEAEVAESQAADAPSAESEAGAEDSAGPEGLDPEEERARVEAAIRAGEEAAERELAADANKIRAERDELQKKLASVGDEIESAKKEAADAKDRLVRLQADWENYRRRTAAERIAEKERAAEKLVCDLLPVIDDLERAIEHAGATEADAQATQMQQFVEGVSAVHAKMLAVLAKEGVEPIDPAGQPFEPLSHQAVGRVEDKDAYDETVAQVYQKGYKMGDKVIRTAMVTVTYGGPKRPAEEPSAGDGADAEKGAPEEATDKNQ